MVRLSELEFWSLKHTVDNIDDTIEYPKDTYEQRVRSLVEIYRLKNINDCLRTVLKAIRLETNPGLITIPRKNKFSLDSYIIYLRVLEKLIDEDKYELVVSDVTHIPSNNYGVKSMLNYELVDMQKAISLGACYDNVKVRRVRGLKYDQLYYRYCDQEIILADKLYLIGYRLILLRYNYMLSGIKLPNYKLPYAYYSDDIVWIPVVGIKCNY